MAADATRGEPRGDPVPDRDAARGARSPRAGPGLHGEDRRAPAAGGTCDAAPRLAARRAWTASPALRDAWRALWVSRLVVWAAGLGALGIWGRAPGWERFDPGGVTVPFGAVGNLLAAPAVRWDSVWYLAIANDGYPEARRTAFFPLYPELVHAVGAVIGSPVAAGMLISFACLLAGLVAVHELAALELGPAAARWTVLALALSPLALFFSAVYSESLFLALSAGAVLAARRGRWWWAGALGALAAATRSTGLLLVVPLALLAIGAHPPRPPWRAWAGIALVPLGLGGYLAGLWATGSDPLAPFNAQAAWFRHFAGPLGAVPDGAVAAWDGLRQLLSGSRDHPYWAKAGGDPMAVARMNLVLFAWVPAAAAALVGAARRLPLAYAAYALAVVALPLSYPVAPQPLASFPRYLLAAFPLWMWLGALLAAHRRARAPVLALSAAALAACSAQFTTWHWVS